MKRRMRICSVAIVMVVARFVINGQVAGQITAFKPVTDAMLLNPDPADWPNWRRTLDGWGYSPLTQIDTRNVKQLQLAWSWGLKPGLSQPNPLVANGMIYVPSPGGGVQTIDVQGFPITYAVGGRQYIAVPVGTGGGQWVTTIPADLTPESKVAQHANGMFVFSLPK